MGRRALLGVLVLPMLATACTSQTDSASQRTHTPASETTQVAVAKTSHTTAAALRSGSVAGNSFPSQCPSTRETGTAAIPQSVRRMKGHWFGRGDLWVNAPRTTAAPGVKFWSVTLDEQGDFTSSKGPPTLTAQRIGGTQTAEMEGTDSSIARVGGHVVQFWPTTLSFPQSGTWLMTESLKDTTLRFCMAVG